MGEVRIPLGICTAVAEAGMVIAGGGGLSIMAWYLLIGKGLLQVGGL